MNSKIMTIIAAIILMALPASAQSIIEAADSAYSTNNYSTALNLYTKAMVTDGTSASLYYNIGNCYYRLGRPGKAIVNYERALRLDPTMADARANLDFVNSRITDRPGTSSSFIGSIIDSAAVSAHANTWAWLALVSFIVTLSAVALYIFADTIMLRKAGFFGAMVLLVITAVLTWFAARGATIARSTDVAIVTSPSTILSTAPRAPKDRNEEAMLLHEGTRLTILDSIKAPLAAGDSVATTWYDAKIDNEHRAWINAADVEKVN